MLERFSATTRMTGVDADAAIERWPSVSQASSASHASPSRSHSMLCEVRPGIDANDFSIRGGFADLNGSRGTHLLLGGDFRTQVVSYSESFPLDGSLTLGFGGSVGDGPDAYYIPVGISLGRRFDVEGSNTTFVPYLHPVIVPTFGGGNSDVNFALGLGVDIRFSDTWAIRASGGIGDIDGVGISVAYIR